VLATARHERRRLRRCGRIGACLVFGGIDLMVRPSARRLPKPARLADFILRLTLGVGPHDSTDNDTK
jgi:hypothetical protein